MLTSYNNNNDSIDFWLIMPSDNAFDFLKKADTKKSFTIDDQNFISFILAIAPIEFATFVEQLVSFLQSAGPEAIKKLDLLAFKISISKRTIESYTKISEDTILHPMDMEKKCAVLMALKKIGLESLRTDLQDPKTGPTRVRLLKNLLFDLDSNVNNYPEVLKPVLSSYSNPPRNATPEAQSDDSSVPQHDFAREEKRIRQIEMEAETIPPVAYHVVFTQNNISNIPTLAIYPKSFSTYQEATNFILNMPGKHKVGKVNYANVNCIYSVVEMQGQETTFDERTKNTLATLISSPETEEWPSYLNSVAKIAERQESITSNKKTYPLEKINEDRLYNPDGTDCVERAINQLDNMIQRLKDVSWVWKIKDKLTEYFNDQPSLRNQKIEALTAVKARLYQDIDRINRKANSLRTVLEEMLDKIPQNSTTTMRQLLQTHRISSNNAGTTRSMDDFNEMLNATRPPDDSEERPDTSPTIPY